MEPSEAAAATAKPPRHPTLQAALWMAGALASFASMAVAVRQLHADMGSFEILAWRNALSIPILAYFMHRNGWRGLATKRLPLHALRNTVHFVGQYGWVAGIGLIPLAQVFAIEFTTPIWTAVLAALILGEVMNRYRAAAVALGFIGILIIVRPGVQSVPIGAIYVVVAALGFAATFICTKKLTRTEEVITILFFMNVMQLPVSGGLALTEWVWPQPQVYPWIAVVATAGLTSHLCVTNALRYADASVVAPMDFLRLPLIAVVGWLAYGEKLEIWVLLGGLVIFLGTYVNVRGDVKTARVT